jgi:predicted small secreted protein
VAPARRRRFRIPAPAFFRCARYQEWVSSAQAGLSATGETVLPHFTAIKFPKAGNQMFKRLIASCAIAAILAGTLATLGGCNTIEGAGKDIEKGGNAIKNEAKEQKRY